MSYVFYAITATIITSTLILSFNKCVRWFQFRRRLVKLIEKLPGPPNIPWSPVLNHTLVVIYLDSLRHSNGTFALAYHVLSNMHKLFPETGLCRFWLGLKPVVMLYSADCVESILSSTSLINKAAEYRFFEPWIGEGLVTSGRNKWRFRRKILTPAFHFRILGDFLPIINSEANKLIIKLSSNREKYFSNGFDITPIVTLCTLDTICETAMGVNINAQAHEQSEYVKALYQVGELALSRVIRPWLWFDFVFFKLTKEGRDFEKALKIMHKFSNRVILERKLEWQSQLENLKEKHGNNLTIDQLRSSEFFALGNKRLAFLDLLLHQHLIERTMSLEDVREEVDTFMFAGHDTTAMCISWTIYMLGLHEDIQQKCRQELDQVFGPSNNDLADNCDLSDISDTQLRELKYLERVVKESLRMWPSIPFVARQMTDDLLVGEEKKYLIPRGTTCMIFTQALHNNPKYFPRPELFDPDRFLPEQCAKRHPFAYIPFSAGARNCIGQKFAQMEVKLILAKVIRNFKIRTLDHRDKLAIVGELVLRSRNGLNVILEPVINKTRDQP